MKRRICMIGPDPKVMGGISSVVTGYLNSSMVRDYELKYISSHKDGSKLKKLIVVAKAYLTFTCMCIFTRPDIIHIHSSFGASFYRKMIFIVMGNLFSVPVVNHIHGAEFDEFYSNATEVKKRLVAWVYLKCDVIIVLSREWKDKLKHEINGLNVKVVENFSTVPNALTVLENRKNIVLFLGYIGKRKGVYDIPNVVKKVITKMSNVKFILCGNGEVEELRKVVKENNLEDYIELKGWINSKQKDELLRSSKIYFLPTYNEGLPMSILEGMAYGLPIVSTNVGGIPTVVSSGINGYIFKPGSVSHFANAILELFDNPNVWKKMHENNINKIRNKFSLELNIKKVSDIYHQIGKRRGNGENQHRWIVNR